MSFTWSKGIWIISHVDFKVVALLMITVILWSAFSQKVKVRNKNYTDTCVKRDVNCKAVTAVLNPSAHESSLFPTDHILSCIVSTHIIWQPGYGKDHIAGYLQTLLSLSGLVISIWVWLNLRESGWAASAENRSLLLAKAVLLVNTNSTIFLTIARTIPATMKPFLA